MDAELIELLEATPAAALGNRLYLQRKACKLSQTAVATGAEVVPAYVSRIEHGHGKPSPEVFDAITRTLGLDPRELLTSIAEGRSLLTPEQVEDNEIRSFLQVTPAEALGARLREIRKTYGLQQEALAVAAGVTVAYVSRVETGQRKPSADVLIAFAGRLDLSPRDILASIGDGPARLVPLSEAQWKELDAISRNGDVAGAVASAVELYLNAVAAAAALISRRPLR